jgi:ferritin-like metal-binding protein YciE
MQPTADPRHDLVTWLRDAHALEMELAPLLDSHARLAAGHPELADGLRRHADETRRHQEVVATCLFRLGADTSGVKDTLMQLSGTVLGPLFGLADDDLVRVAVLDFAGESLEIAGYRAIVHASRLQGLEEVARACEQVLRDEQRMAAWLQQQIPRVVEMRQGEPVGR